MTKATIAKKTNKTDKVVALLKRQQGASLEELTKATDWLPHTTRAAMTGLRKKGHVINRAKVNGVSRYTIATGA
ncbi:DUF3489 domain-containing protein [Sphingopyxis sp. XHP0097]|uniref:DUF3489 domain-containing protein n=1 Tax=Sphingopyxis jiangsuensis TaxID=2871171 RepID=A0ABS7MH70_9SPHN|nr:DUF3489 domain-containing protein [Sphingopyxis jiangsuensis]MBY4638365.1 DUF3489 domain-containing protein [Sphingopyxis jiangsuensis]